MCLNSQNSCQSLLLRSETSSQPDYDEVASDADADAVNGAENEAKKSCVVTRTK